MGCDADPCAVPPVLVKKADPEASCRLPFGQLEESKKLFLQKYSRYGYNGWIDNKWQAEVGTRLGPGSHYLDHTGSGLYTNSQVTAALQELTSNAFGNPHSRNPSSARATQEVDNARTLILKHFNADPGNYYVIFTKGATEGLKMVGEYFPWSSSSRFIYTQANHKSVLGIGAYAKAAGSQLHCLTRAQMEEWFDTPAAAAPPTTSNCGSLRRGPVGCGREAGECPVTPAYSDTGSSMSGISYYQERASSSSGDSCASGFGQFEDSPRRGGSRLGPAAAGGMDGGGARPGTGVGSATCCHLVAYPAKDNYEGQLYPLSWIKQVHAKSTEQQQYLVVLDAAAYASTHVLDLSAVQPDFVPISFYKLFGYPSGLGALLVHKGAAAKLKKVYFGGGSADYCTAEDVWHVLSQPPAGLEDGTLNFLSIASLKHGFKLIQDLGGMEAVAAHVDSLTAWTYAQLHQLSHSNGAPLLKLFGRHGDGPAFQSGIFQFQLLTPERDRVPPVLVEAAATAANLHLRTGCNCNPGRCLANMGIKPEEERARAAQGHKGPILIVMRPRAALATAGGLAYEKEGGEGQGLMPVPLPTGSVRASLGPLSTWEDCYALLRFLTLTFTDLTFSDLDIAAGEKFVRVESSSQEGTFLQLKATISEEEHWSGGDGFYSLLRSTPCTPSSARAAAAAEAFWS